MFVAPRRLCAPLAFLTAGVLVAACHSAEPPLIEADAGPSPILATEPPPVEERVEVADAAAPSCPAPTPAEYPWRAPAAPEEGACSEADLARLSARIEAKDLAAPEDMASALGPSCAQCAVGKVADGAWKAVVLEHRGYVGNVGGCVMRLGADAACGQAIDELSTCLILGCADCKGRSAQDGCADKLTKTTGPCAGALRRVRKGCSPSSIAVGFDASGPCQSFVGTIRLFCGVRGDGGT